MEILARGVKNRRKRLFLESLHSTLTANAVNKRQRFPKANLPLLHPFGTQESLKKSFNYPQSVYSDEGSRRAAKNSVFSNKGQIQWLFFSF